MVTEIVQAITQTSRPEDHAHPRDMRELVEEAVVHVLREARVIVMCDECNCYMPFGEPTGSHHSTTCSRHRP